MEYTVRVNACIEEQVSLSVPVPSLIQRIELKDTDSLQLYYINGTRINTVVYEEQKVNESFDFIVVNKEPFPHKFDVILELKPCS